MLFILIAHAKLSFPVEVAASFGIKILVSKLTKILTSIRNSNVRIPKRLFEIILSQIFLGTVISHSKYHRIFLITDHGFINQSTIYIFIIFLQNTRMEINKVPVVYSHNFT